VIVRIPRSKTDQAGDGADVALPRMRGEETCPVRALEDWLRRSARVVFEFLSADWTPWQAILRLRRDWPTLVLAVQPRFGETDGPGDALRRGGGEGSAVSRLPDRRRVVG
ncbi:MAG TPA: hypothetical protein VFE41_32560, partial [Acetobacteraceae bacterium]|nr:hypothetical protein [Acetobacteraceae bacterium]